MSLKKIAIPLIVSIGVAFMAFTNVHRSTTNNTEKCVNEN
ncbi:hypothetical protein LCGC14_2201020, partial [marine sediment metagenome]